MTHENAAFSAIDAAIHRAMATLHRSIAIAQGAIAANRSWAQTSAQALTYLDAVTPHAHPGRMQLLELLDIHRRTQAHGDEDGEGVAIADALATALAEAYDRVTPEVYTLTTILDVDTWMSDEDRAEMTVRLIAPGELAIPPLRPLGTLLEPGHHTPTLVFYTSGLPHAQVAVNGLIRMHSTAAAADLASQPHARCGHIDCEDSPGYVVALDDHLLVTCAGHLAHALRSRGGYVIALAPSS